jgi:phenylacetate-coenzyme A ligase PaaK-like adenylate-forming protein
MRVLGVLLRISTGYTSNETGCIAFRCRYLPENTFHVHEAQSVVRIVGPDGVDVAVGETGSIVVTSLNRTLLPIINYKLGDRGCMLPPNADDGGVCGCGRRLRLLQLAGRSGGVMRVGAEDLSLEQVATALSHCPQLTLLFSVHITKSQPRLFDLVDVHIEACCHLDAVDKEQTAEQFVQALLRHCPFFNLELMERPIATILAPGELPRNPRTGKITPVVDMR